MNIRSTEHVHHDHHEHTHTPHHHHHATGKNLVFTVILNVCITVAEILGGIFAGSIALLADASHNLSDVILLLVTYLAHKIAKRPSSEDKTFGYKRIEIIASILNISLINLISVAIIIFAIVKLVYGSHPDAILIIIVAGFSIICNALSAVFIKEDAGHNISIRYAYIHLFGDMLTSIIVLLSGVIILLTKFYILDTLISIGISLYLIYIGIGIFYTSYKIVMEFTPSSVNLETIKSTLLELPYVIDIHHVHLWSITENDIRIEMHVRFTKDYKLSEVHTKLNEIKIILREKFNILACGLQAEYGEHLETKLVVDER